MGIPGHFLLCEMIGDAKHVHKGANGQITAVLLHVHVGADAMDIAVIPDAGCWPAGVHGPVTL